MPLNCFMVPPPPLYYFPNGLVFLAPLPVRLPSPGAIKVQGTTYFLDNHRSYDIPGPLNVNGTTYFPQSVVEDVTCAETENTDYIPGSYVKNGTTFFPPPQFNTPALTDASSLPSTSRASSAYNSPTIEKDCPLKGQDDNDRKMLLDIHDAFTFHGRRRSIV